METPYKDALPYENAGIYDYDFMVSQDPMVVATMPSLSSVKTGNNVDQDKAIKLGLENASAVGREVGRDQYAIKNNYTKREIVLGNNGLSHSLDARDKYRLRTNARLSAIGGEIVRNAIPINGLKKKNQQARGTYAMACLVYDGNNYVVAIVTVDEFSSKILEMDYVDITHSINGRRQKNTGDSRSASRASELEQTLLPGTAISNISIADFLEIVNNTHRSILSSDVLAHFGETRPTDGYYSGSALFQDRTVGTSNRSLLANAFESVAQNDIERKRIQEYRENIGQLNEQEKKLQELRAEIRELSFGKGKRDTEKLKQLREEAIKTANRNSQISCFISVSVT